MLTVQQLGAFKVTSPKLVVIDPGYTLDTAELRHGGCFVAPCRLGSWKVEVTMDAPPSEQWRIVPRTLVALHAACERIPVDSDWERVAEEIGQDGGVIGLYDVAHFQDMSVIPSDHKVREEENTDDSRWLWYRFVCDVLGKHDAAVVPYGATVHWDGGMDVDCFTMDAEIIGIRPSISGWPDKI
jgi:hypothetical protein